MPCTRELLESIQCNATESESTIRRLFASREYVTELDAQVRIPLLYATALGHLNIVQLLIELGVDINEPHHENQMCALHVAASLGFLDCVQTLLHFGALTNSRDNQGWTPLMFAVQGGVRFNCRNSIGGRTTN